MRKSGALTGNAVLFAAVVALGLCCVSAFADTVRLPRSGCTLTDTTACSVAMDKAKTVRAAFEKPKPTAGPDRIEVFGE
jgi:hypothetical protein